MLRMSETNKDLILRSAPPISGLPEIGIMMRKSATADLRGARLEGWTKGASASILRDGLMRGPPQDEVAFTIRYSLEAWSKRDR